MVNYGLLVPAWPPSKDRLPEAAGQPSIVDPTCTAFPQTRKLT